jgi:hypothetical protein
MKVFRKWIAREGGYPSDRATRAKVREICAACNPTTTGRITATQIFTLRSAELGTPAACTSTS